MNMSTKLKSALASSSQGHDDNTNSRPFPKREKASELPSLDKKIVSALKLDVDTLAQRFCAEQSMSLASFGKLFIESEFSTIFLGRFSTSDLVEFSENLLLYSARFMFESNQYTTVPNYIDQRAPATGKLVNVPIPRSNRNAERSPNERVFGIYLCYCLYFLQPSQYVIPIRITGPQLDDIYEFMNSFLLPEEQFEALYCLWRLINVNAFTIIPFDGNFNPLLNRNFDFFDADSTSAKILKNIECTGNFSFLRSFGEDPLLQKANDLHRHYMVMKKELSGVLPSLSTPSFDSPLDTTCKLLEEAELTFAQTDNSTDATLDVHKSVMNRRKRIREEAFAQSGQIRRDRRHRLSSDDLFEEFTGIGEGSSNKHQKAANKVRNQILASEIDGKKRSKAGRKRSRSRTLELDEGTPNAVEAFILQKIDNEQANEERVPHEAHPGLVLSAQTSRGNEPFSIETNLPQIDLQQIAQEAAETDELLKKVLKRTPKKLP